MVLGAVTFALLSAVDVVFKLLATDGHPTCQILVINGSFAMLPVLLWAKATGGWGRLATARLPYHLARGGASVLSTFAGIYAYSRLPLTDFYAIVFTGPLMITAFGALCLGEKVGPRRWAAIAVGFIGTLVVVNPLASPLLHIHNAPMNAQQMAAVLGRGAAFACVFFYALSVIMIRRMRGDETSVSFCFYGFAASLLISGTLCLVYDWPPLAAADIAHLALSGTMAGIAGICIMEAYHRTPVALVAPFQYTQIIWGALAGYVIWRHVPSHHLMAGAAIVAASGLYIIHREMIAQKELALTVKPTRLRSVVREK